MVHQLAAKDLLAAVEVVKAAAAAAGLAGASDMQRHQMRHRAVQWWAGQDLCQAMGPEHPRLGIKGSDALALLLFGPYISALNAKTAELPPGQGGRISVPVINAHTGQHLPHRLLKIPAIIKETVSTYCYYYKLELLKVRDSPAVV